MPTDHRVQHLLSRVSFRAVLAKAGRRWTVAFLVCAGVYLLVLSVCRLGGIGPALWPWWSLLLPAAVAVFAALLQRRPSQADIAHLVDRRADTGDVFLTWLDLKHGAGGDYSALVGDAARERAADLTASDIVPLRNPRAVRGAVLGGAVLVAAYLWLPALDPFGHQEARRKVEQQRERLSQERQVAETKRAELVKRQSAGDAGDVAKAVDALKSILKSMEPGRKQRNLQRLTDQQAVLGTLWREQSRKDLKRALARRNAQQRLGDEGARHAARWEKQLSQGSTRALTAELEQLRNMVEELASTRDPEKAQTLSREIAQRLKTLSRFAQDAIASPEIADSLNRALQQLAMMSSQALESGARDALISSLDLTAAQLEELARMMRDMDMLEEALQAAQLAKMANLALEEGLDGEACEGCDTLADYAELYAKCLGRGAGGAGLGMLGPGTGEGNVAPEDPTRQTQFQGERSRSALRAGRMLMQWKVREMGPVGQASDDYAVSVKQLAQGVNEAIAREKIPPGYHATIKDYFSALEEDHAATSEEAED